MAKRKKKEIIFNSHCKGVTEECKTAESSNLLTELLQVGHDAVAQTVLHVLSQEVRRAHYPQRLSEGLREEHRGKKRKERERYLFLLCRKMK